MATIIANKKNGKIVSYRFRAYLGRNEFGEQIARYATWHIPDGLTPSRAAKAAETAALAWERQIKETYKNAAADSEGVSSRQDKKIEFSDFVLNTWFPICIENGEHKPTTVSFYRYTVNRLVTHFRGRAIQDVSTIEIKKYLAYLRKDYRTKQGKPLSDKTIRHPVIRQYRHPAEKTVSRGRSRGYKKPHQSRAGAESSRHNSTAEIARS